jgi:DNA-binding transcriptional ArsR family regulator
MTGTPPTPLDHRARRRILRHLHEAGHPRPASELTTDLDLQLNETLYHLRVLAKYDTVAEKPEEDGANPARFESKISDNAKIIELLASTRAQDETQ